MKSGLDAKLLFLQVDMLSNRPYQKFLKCWRNDLKMNRSVGFQHAGLTKEFIVELNW